jgi:hypothetical protein
MNDRNSGSKTEGRNDNGTFAQGNPGKPKGSRHKATQAVQDLLEGQTEALTQAIIDKALEGDVPAMRLCIERIAPARKDSPIQFDLPKITTASEAADAARAVLSAVADGLVTPLEGAAVMGLIEQFRRTLETTELEARLAALEAAK